MLSAIIPREPGNPAHNHKLQRPASLPWRLRHTFCAPKLTQVASQPVHNEQRACITMHAIHSSTLQFSVYKWLGSLFYVYGITHHYTLSIWEYGKWLHDEAIEYVCNWPRAQVAVPNKVCSMPNRVRCISSSMVLVRGTIVPS